jgi:hypothetical protein
MMALDKLIESAKSKGGIPESILLDPNEAYSLLLEAKRLRREYARKLSIRKKDQQQIEGSLVLWNSTMTDESIKELVGKWYKREYIVTYLDVELRIIKQKKEGSPLDVPKPKMPDNQWIEEGSTKWCGSCGSSLKSKWLLWHHKGCINPNCKNYYKSKDE